MRHIPDLARKLEADLKAAGIPIESVLKAAQTDRSTWTRWKAGTMQPRFSSWERVQCTAEHLLSYPEKSIGTQAEAQP
jgi:hypothetical protein